MLEIQSIKILDFLKKLLKKYTMRRIFKNTKNKGKKRTQESTNNLRQNKLTIDYDLVVFNHPRIKILPSSHPHKTY